MTPRIRPSTFSIVACDLEAEEWGVAVASKFLAVGSVVPFVRAGDGAVATQAHVNTTFGPEGLELMALGYSAQDALDRLVSGDEGREHRQVGMVDGHGRSATFTGEECYSWAGGRTGPGFAAQGNILTGPEVVDRMADAFETRSGSLVDRLVDALWAGQQAGGDSRGRQSAAVYVAKPKGGYGGYSDRFVDLRVDDHPDPIPELRRLLELHKLYMFPTRDEDILPIDESTARRIQDILRRSGLRSEAATGTYDSSTRKALEQLSGIENLEERWRDGPEIDRVVLEFLGEKYGVK